MKKIHTEVFWAFCNQNIEDRTGNGINTTSLLNIEVPFNTVHKVNLRH